jgi:hypothetical protein
MTNAQTSNKAKRENIFRRFMSMTTRQGFTADQTVRTIAGDLGVEIEVITDSLNRTLVGR